MTDPGERGQSEVESLGSMPRVRVSRPGRIPAVLLLIAIALALLAWPVTRYLGPRGQRTPKGLFEYPGITWSGLDRAPGRMGGFNLIANIIWNHPPVAVDESMQFTKKLSEETRGKYRFYLVRVYAPGGALLAEVWSDGLGSKINVKPVERPIDGPVAIPAMTWKAIMVTEIDNAILPRLTVEVKFDEPEVVSVPYVEYVLGRLISSTRGCYEDYYLHAYNRKDQEVIEMWANGNGTRYRSLPKEAYYKQ